MVSEHHTGNAIVKQVINTTVATNTKKDFQSDKNKNRHQTLINEDAVYHHDIAKELEIDLEELVTNSSTVIIDDFETSDDSAAIPGFLMRGPGGRLLSKKSKGPGSLLLRGPGGTLLSKKSKGPGSLLLRGPGGTLLSKKSKGPGSFLMRGPGGRLLSKKSRGPGSLFLRGPGGRLLSKKSKEQGLDYDTDLLFGRKRSTLAAVISNYIRRIRAGSSRRFSQSMKSYFPGPKVFIRDPNGRLVFSRSFGSKEGQKCVQ